VPDAFSSTNDWPLLSRWPSAALLRNRLAIATTLITPTPEVIQARTDHAEANIARNGAAANSPVSNRRSLSRAQNVAQPNLTVKAKADKLKQAGKSASPKTGTRNDWTSF